MSQIEEIEKRILGGLIPGKPEEVAQCSDNLQFLATRVPVEKFTPKSQSLVQAMIVFQEASGGTGVMGEGDLVTMLAGSQAPAEKQVEYQDLYHQASLTATSAAGFKFLVNELVKLLEEESFMGVMNDAFTVFKDGVKQGKKELKGYAAARRVLADRLSELDQEYGTFSFPEGDPRAEADQVYQEAQEARDNPEEKQGIMTGWAEFDNATNGLQKKQFVLIGGYAAVGKTCLVVDWAHHFVTSGYNVVVGTVEVGYDEYRTRFAVRHSRSPDWGLPQGVSWISLGKGDLSPEEMTGFETSTKDFKANPNYGQVRIFQIPEGGGMDFCKAKLLQYEKQFPIDVFICDSINQAAPLDGDNRRITLNSEVSKGKFLANDWANGRGLVHISPWHANRRSFEKAREEGCYNKNSWAESDEIERRLDKIVWLLDTEQSIQTREYIWGMCKNRQGPEIQPRPYYADFESCYVGESGQAGGSPTTPGMSPGTNVFAERTAGLW